MKIIKYILLWPILFALDIGIAWSGVQTFKECRKDTTDYLKTFLAKEDR